MLGVLVVALLGELVGALVGALLGVLVGASVLVGPHLIWYLISLFEQPVLTRTTD